MKKKFSTSWKSSKQPRKQRKYLANAPLHLKRKILGVNLSKELRKKHGKRNVVVRKGDNVKVLRGKFKKKTGKILRVFTKLGKVEIEGIQVKKLEGSKVNVKLQPSNLQIIELNLDDRRRFKDRKEIVEAKALGDKVINKKGKHEEKDKPKQKTSKQSLTTKKNPEPKGEDNLEKK